MIEIAGINYIQSNYVPNHYFLSLLSDSDPDLELIPGEFKT